MNDRAVDVRRVRTSPRSLKRDGQGDVGRSGEARRGSPAYVATDSSMLEEGENEKRTSSFPETQKEAEGDRRDPCEGRDAPGSSSK